MGNSNSSENTRRYKIYKIVTKSNYSDWFRCYLDDDVPYSNGNYKYMDFEEDSNTYSAFRLLAMAGGGPVQENAILDEGCYIAVNISSTRNLSCNYKFTRRDVRTVGRERVDSSGNINFVSFVGEIGNAINEARERHNFMTQQARQQDHFYAWHLEPPKR